MGMFSILLCFVLYLCVKNAQASNLAICISGGVRGGDYCAKSHIEAVIKPSMRHFEQVEIFYATWTERDCRRARNRDENPNPGLITINNTVIRDFYQDVVSDTMPINIWLDSEKNYSRNWHTEEELKKLKKEKWPFRYSMPMMSGCHMMVSLWDKCMAMIDSSKFDVVMRLRPDYCFNNFTRIEVFPKFVRLTYKEITTVVSMKENTIYIPKSGHSNTVRQVVDDKLAFGYMRPMKEVFGTLENDTIHGVYDVTDSEYHELYPKEREANFIGDPNVNRDHPLNPKGFWVRERYAELLLTHAIQRKNVSVEVWPDVKYDFAHPTCIMKGC